MTNCSELRLKIDKPKSTPKRKPKKRLIDIGKTEDPQKYIDFYQDLEKRLSRKRRRVMARKNFKKCNSYFCVNIIKKYQFLLFK